ncbi:hypothetical protein RIF29_36439 [Crotalaria pallida]|uniref:Uncharacterized protein n=1 Tax=Crotalaria pallida TaxID=3830 RepID=A0AAN9HYJ8_CROPI
MDEPKLPSQSHDSSIPLIARLDHLEFIMKYLERKQRCGNNVTADKLTLDLAKKENYFKGTLLDRVACLEHRLYQLFLEMDSSGSSLPLSRASTETSGESSSSQGSKGETFYSFPTFNNLPNFGDKGMPQSNSKTTELQEKSEIIQHQMKKSSPPTQQVVKKEKNKPKKSNDQKHKGGKKPKPPIAWPHLKLLGC